ncbi:hypothetical protein [Streptomyces sp. MMG1121]|uniref:hypothetical protein n=1 Tax=Streptomyces sp. MMG1121 TaxID=1415544 RepID=UPI000A667ED1|nr:hypothetical protein [Streptomyces sp. MMG1121]
MITELLHGDLCPLCRRPLTLRTTVEVRSNTPYPTRTDTVPYCAYCANDPRTALGRPDAHPLRQQTPAVRMLRADYISATRPEIRLPPTPTPSNAHQRTTTHHR